MSIMVVEQLRRDMEREDAALQAGVMSLDEARAIEGCEPAPPPKTYIPANIVDTGDEMQAMLAEHGRLVGPVDVRHKGDDMYATVTYRIAGGPMPRTDDVLVFPGEPITNAVVIDNLDLWLCGLTVLGAACWWLTRIGG